MTTNKKPHGYWTKERVFEESKKFTTSVEFRKHSPSAYSIAKKQHWLHDMPYLIHKTKPNGFWRIKENVFEASKECTSRSEFKKKYSSASDYAHRMGWIDEMPWLNRNGAKFIRPYFIYVYTDEENRVAYVGLTNDKDERHKTHISGLYRGKQSQSEVYRYFTKIGKPVPNPVYLEEGLSSQDARLREKYWENYYRTELNYTMLNIATCGCLGGGAKKWTKEAVFEESKKYKGRLEFAKKSVGAYHVALQNGWLDEMTWFVSKQKPHGYWNKDKVFEVAHLCKTVKEFRRQYACAYGVALKNKWVDKMDWFDRSKPKPHNFKWSKEAVFEESKKYTMRSEFYKKNATAYGVAKRNSWLNEMPWLSIEREYRTKEEVFEIAKQYTFKQDFNNEHPNCYDVARKHGWLKEMVWLKNTIAHTRCKKWSKEAVFEESKKYHYRAEFHKGCSSAYYTAVRNNWFYEMPWILPKYQTKRWTKEKVIEVSKNYKTKREFCLGKRHAYDAARDNGWFSEMPWLFQSETNK